MGDTQKGGKSFGGAEILKHQKHRTCDLLTQIQSPERSQQVHIFLTIICQQKANTFWYPRVQHDDLC